MGSLFFLLVSPFCSSQAQAELSLLIPLSSSRNTVIPTPFPLGWNFHAGGSSSQHGDLPPATLPIDSTGSTGPHPHPPLSSPHLHSQLGSGSLPVFFSLPLAFLPGCIPLILPFHFISSCIFFSLGSDLSSRKDGPPFKTLFGAFPHTCHLLHITLRRLPPRKK